jgi:Rps23 Pro-64 3,4-dihydroxylase Tpa1-like proline 4-hydroxylase
MSANKSILNPDLFSAAHRAKLAREFAESAPFPHCAIRPLCDEQSMRDAHAELLALEATYKETDLFKLYQTADFANYSDAAAVRTLLKLRDALYSNEMRAFVEHVTQCGALSDRVDCAANVYMRGSHLLAHDDVIGTRRVSYIIYLSEPDEPWVQDDGGALELYALDAPGTPAASPCATLLPYWNSMAMFVVEPGVSFHSVQEVFAPSKWRISIQGWYHAAAPPADAHLASIRQLTATATELADAHKTPFVPLSLDRVTNDDDDDDDDDNEDEEQFESFDLSPDDMAELALWVSPMYLSEDAIDAILDKMVESGSVQLHNFLLPERHDSIMAALRAVDVADQVGGRAAPAPYATGVQAPWSLIGPPHLRRLLQLDDAKLAALAQSSTELHERAALELDKVRRFLLSPAFARLLFALCARVVTAERAHVRRFRPSLDYTVAHYGDINRQNLLLATLCFCDESVDDNEADNADDDNDGPSVSIWRSGEVGGFECFIVADEDGEQAAASAEVYRPNMADEEPGLLSVSAASNSLNLLLYGEGLMHFVKYVSAAAPGSRWDVACEFQLAEEDGEEDQPEEAAAEAEVEVEEQTKTDKKTKKNVAAQSEPSNNNSKRAKTSKK